MMKLFKKFRERNQLPFSTRITTTLVPHNDAEPDDTPYIYSRHVIETHNNGKTWFAGTEVLNRHNGTTSITDNNLIPFQKKDMQEMAISPLQVLEYICGKELDSLNAAAGFGTRIINTKDFANSSRSRSEKVQDRVKDFEPIIGGDPTHVTKAIRDFERTNPPLTTPNAVALKLLMARAGIMEIKRPDQEVMIQQALTHASA